MRTININILYVFTAISLLTMGSTITAININAIQPASNEKTSLEWEGSITVEYHERFTRDITQITDLDISQEKIENLRRWIETIEGIYSKKMWEISQKEKMINTYLERILEEIITWNIFPTKTPGEKLLRLLYMGKQWTPLRRYLSSRFPGEPLDDFLFNINCRLFLLGRLVEPDLTSESYIGFNLPWYLRYREHFKPGCLITYGGLLKNDVILGDFWITGRMFRGFWINIGFPGNYLDFTIGWTAYIMAHQT